jgi:hypothetical protein
MVEPGTHIFALLPFLQKNEEIKQLGLRVESCRPETINVEVVKLIKKALEVKCFDEDGNPVKAATIAPGQVDMFVPSDWAGETLVAKVQLGWRETEQARVLPIEKIPSIELPGQQSLSAQEPVQITMPAAAELLSDYTITTATLGFTLSSNLQGKYEVDVTNLPEVISAITIRATSEAKQAYENMFYQVMLEIYDDDAKADEPSRRRELIYNFPTEYVRKDEIVLKQQPVIARFELVEISKQPSIQTTNP